MIDLAYRSYSLLDPCKFSESTRAQAYANGDQQSWTPGSQMRFSLPNDATLDMSESYIDFDVTLSNMQEEQPIVLRIDSRNAVTGASPVDAASGTFAIEWFGQITEYVSWNANTTVDAVGLVSLQTALRELLVLTGFGYQIDVFPNNTLIHTAINTADSIRIVIGNFDSYSTMPRELSEFTIVNNSFFNAVPQYIVLTLSIATVGGITFDGAFSSPRLERYAPLFDQVQVLINDKTIIDIADYHILDAIDQATDATFGKLEKYTGTSATDTGLGFGIRSTIRPSGIGNDIFRTYLSPIPGQFESLPRRVRIYLDKIGIFRQLLPLNLLNNAQIRIHLRLELPTRALIITNAVVNNNNPDGQSYQISNGKFHFHTLTIPYAEQQMLSNIINSADGLVIPFRNWSNFSQAIAANLSNSNIIFNPSQSNMLGLYFVFHSLDYEAFAANRRKLTAFLKNEIERYRLKVGSEYFPRDYIQSSNIYPYLTEMVKELINFTELVKYKIIEGDFEAFLNYAAAPPYTSTADPTGFAWTPAFSEPTNQLTIMAISTSDIGYDPQHKLCEKVALDGVNTSGLTNVQIELNGMIYDQNMQIDIYTLHQDYLIFRGNMMEWKH